MSDDEITLTDVTVTPATPTEAAYQRVLNDILAVTQTNSLGIDIDVMSAVNGVLVALPRIRALRPRIAAEWRNFDFERFDKLEDYALALSHAHSLYRACGAAKGSVAERARALSRQQAFTLFERAYAEARRAVSYLRAPWGDADAIAPSLRACRAGHRNKRAPGARAQSNKSNQNER